MDNLDHFFEQQRERILRQLYPNTQRREAPLSGTEDAELDPIDRILRREEGEPDGE